MPKQPVLSALVAAGFLSLTAVQVQAQAQVPTQPQRAVADPLAHKVATDLRLAIDAAKPTRQPWLREAAGQRWVRVVVTGQRRSADACTWIGTAVAQQDNGAHEGTVVQAWVASTLAVSQVGTDTTSPTTMMAGFAICSAAAISTIDSRFPTLTRWSGA